MGRVAGRGLSRQASTEFSPGQIWTKVGGQPSRQTRRSGFVRGIRRDDHRCLHRAGSSRPLIRTIATDDVYAALAAGWADFRAAPRFGLFFGGVYALLGIRSSCTLWVLDQPFWIVPFAFAFPLIGPFAAIGLYEVSRRREAGEPLDWAEILGVVWSKRDSQIPSMAFIVLAGFMIWMWVASMLVILFLGRMSGAIYSDLGALLGTGNGIDADRGRRAGRRRRSPSCCSRSPRCRCRCCSIATSTTSPRW